MYKVAITCICLNKEYWQYITPMIESARQHLLKGHQVDFILWTDMPEGTKVDATIIPTEPFAWPLPTLFRYSLFIQQEELLREYDYVFYCDADMKFVSRVGDEILGDITAAQHPMYALDKKYIPPYEPNEKSTAFIPRPGRVIVENGQKRFEPLYFAGGFQGGRAENWISAMKEMQSMIDEDFTKNNYVAVWNDESYWNKYLLLHPPTVVLSPSYIYPDSLNKAYYQKIWGRNYVPKLITITKKHTLSSEAGTHLTNNLQKL